jgi:hypothetical protein
MIRKAGTIASLVVCAAFGQTPGSDSLSGLVQADVARLGSQPTLAAWQRAHSTETRIEGEYTNWEYETQGLWCAGSAASITLSNGIVVKRFALFYVPERLGTLPVKVDKSLADRCELKSIWYEVNRAPSLTDFVDAVVRELGAVWGEGEQVPRRSKLRRGWGWGNWEPFFNWQTSEFRVVVAIDPNGRANAGERALVLARLPDTPTEVDPALAFGITPSDQPSLTDEADKIAALSLPVPRVINDSLAAWVKAARALPAPRRAAALLVADLAVKGAGNTPDHSLEAMGARFQVAFGESAYTHNWRSEAEALDPKGPAGELARIAHLEDSCSFEGKSDWRDGLIRFGEQVLRDFPAGKWAPYVHYILARAYDAKLLRTYLEGDSSASPSDAALDPVKLRESAIAHFRAYLNEKPSDPDAGYALKEAWRLLAGLPPTPIHFGCNND